jgi:hypothetical protein
MKRWLPIVISLLTPALFAGHGLCNNSGGFRLTKHFIENDPLVQSEVPNLAAKLESGEDLTPNELDYFELAYDQVASDTLKKIDQTFNDINQHLAKSDQLNIVCSDRAEALDYALTGTLKPDVAAEEAFNSIDLDLRIERQQASDLRLDKNFYDILKHHIYADTPHLLLFGKPLPEEVVTLIRDNPQLDRMSQIQFTQFFEAHLSPENIKIFSQDFSADAVYSSLENLEVGDGGILGFKTHIHIADHAGQLGTGHSLYLQRTSPTRLFIFDSIKGRGTFIDIKNDLNAFTEACVKDTKKLYLEIYKKLKAAEELPEDNPLRKQKIALLKSQSEQIFHFIADKPLEKIDIYDISSITHGTHPPLE